MAASAARLEQRPHATGTAGGLTVRAAVDAFLDSPKINRSPHTRRAYANVLDRTADVLGAERDLAGVSDAELGEALTRLWGGCAESTWNRNRAAVGSWLAWCAGRQHWDAPFRPGAQSILDRAVARGELTRLSPRTYVRTTRLTEPWVRWAAALRYAGNCAALSFVTGLQFWRLMPPSPGAVHITIGGDRQLRGGPPHPRFGQPRRADVGAG